MRCVRNFIVVLLLISMSYPINSLVSQQKTELDTTALWKKTGTSEIEYFENRFGRITAITTHSFLYRYAFNDDEIVISQSVRHEHGPYEGVFPSLTAEAFRVKNGKMGQSIWKISDKCDSGKLLYFSGLLKMFYQTTRLIGGGALPLKTLYSLESGEVIFCYNRDLLRVAIPNSRQSRMFAYYLPLGKRKPGTLYYCTSDSIIHEIQFSPKNHYDWDEFPYIGSAKIEFSNFASPNKKYNEYQLDLWAEDFSKDPESFTGFSIAVQFYKKDTVKIPIVKNDFDLSNVSSEFVQIKRIK